MLHKLDKLKRIDLDLFKNARSIQRSNPTFIPIHLTGGIGDVICLIDTIKALASKHEVMVYTKHIEAFKYFCSDLFVFDEIPDYFWHLELDSLARFVLFDDFQGFLIKSHEELFVTHKNVMARNPRLQFLAESKKHFLINEFCKSTVFNKRDLGAYCLGLTHV